MDTVPESIEWWRVPDSRSGNKVAWAYDPSSRTAYIAFRKGTSLLPYAYFDISPELVREVGTSGYVSLALERVKAVQGYRPLEPFPETALKSVN